MQTAFKWITKQASLDVKFYDEMVTGYFFRHVVNYRFSDPNYYFSRMETIAENMYS